LTSARADVVATPAQDDAETTPPDDRLTPAATDPTHSAEAEKDTVVVAAIPVASRASRNYQPGARPASVPVWPQDLAIMPQPTLQKATVDRLTADRAYRSTLLVWCGLAVMNGSVRRNAGV
jgi:hypothetical protein